MRMGPLFSFLFVGILEPWVSGLLMLCSALKEFVEDWVGIVFSIICCVAIGFVPLPILMFRFVSGSKLSFPVVSASVFASGEWVLL